MAENATQSDLTAALNGLWQQFLPLIDERVAVLEAAGQALAGGNLSDEQREAATSAAHKLAGVLGTFGLTKGTVLAREAEMLCTGDADPASAPQLSDIAAQLRTIISGHA
jgi:HPt (histidine-containing phosphotransfer) domain-containing protein